MKAQVASAISKLDTVETPISVSLSTELVNLLSDQLYQSPLKAIEELVVNSYDADATECRIFVPSPSDTDNRYVIVFDNGIGMDYEGLSDLWQIGRSNKRNNGTTKSTTRKQIGKFGIGKLAAKTIANKLTYITKNEKNILTVSIDFGDFKDLNNGKIKKVTTKVHEIKNLKEFTETSALKSMIDNCGIPEKSMPAKGTKTWTLAILEDLTDKSEKIKLEHLTWVLSTAMPLAPQFKIFLNKAEVKSSKENYDVLVKFKLKDLPNDRIKTISKVTGEDWKVVKNSLVSESFPSGIKGTVIVTKQSLSGGKSDDLMRSHGFFVKVLDRLVNETDPLFGLKALFFGTFVRFRADINADDLDADLKSSRETLEETTLKNNFRAVLRELYNEANTRYERHEAENNKKRAKKEGERDQVPPQLVEFPVADVLSASAGWPSGAEADDSWFYLELDSRNKPEELAQLLYKAPRRKYEYKYESGNRTDRLVKFNPQKSLFVINKDHEFISEYINDSGTRGLLQDFVTSEALLEVYLRLNNVPSVSIGKILEQRDKLLRNLAQDRSYSYETIARRLRDSAAEEHELEIALVVAARSLGFVATHVSGSGKPDGVATFVQYPNGEVKITLEAKSSEKTPSLGALDIAGLEEHKTKHEGKGAVGCLLIAPKYPGSGAESSAVADRARKAGVSCWTIEQLARVIEVAEKRQFTAQHILQIVQSAYSPKEVTEQVEKLLSEPSWDKSDLYNSILEAIDDLQGRLPDTPRTIDIVAAEVSRKINIQRKDVEQALFDIQGASKGGLLVREEKVVLDVSLQELERRLGSFLKKATKPRRISSFRKYE